MGNISDSIDEDNKIFDELYSHAPQDRENVLRWYGRSRSEFSWVDYGDEESTRDPKDYNIHISGDRGSNKKFWITILLMYGFIFLTLYFIYIS